MSGPILARALGPEGRGQFAAVMQPVTVAGAIASLGVPAAVTYFVARKHHPRSTFRAGLKVCAVPATITYLLMVWYSGQVSRAQDLPRWILVMAWLAIPLSAIVQTRRALLQGLSNWRRLDIERGSFAILRFVLVVAVALIGYSTAGPYVAASLVAFVLAALILWAPSARAETQGGAATAPTKAIRSYSIAAAVGTVAVVANNRLDQVLFPAAGSSNQLGFYAVAVTVAEVPAIFAALAARKILTLSSKGDPLGLILKNIRVYLAGLVLASLALAAASPAFVKLIFGSEFEPATGSVIVLTASTIVAGGALALSSFLGGRGRPGLGSLMPVAGLIVTVVSFAVMWGEMTSWSAAWISLASQVAALLCGAVLLSIFIKDRKTN